MGLNLCFIFVISVCLCSGLNLLNSKISAAIDASSNQVQVLLKNTNKVMSAILIASSTTRGPSNGYQRPMPGGKGATSVRPRPSGRPIVQQPPSNEVRTEQPSSGSFIRDAVRIVGPSVVRIDCEREVSSLMSVILSPEMSPKEGDIVKISGSGFVASSDGFILTNAHVVNQARRITITLSNGRTFKASMVACDELTDLAVLKAEIGNIRLREAPLGDSSKLHSGDWLIAVGCPVGLDFTVTLGIVSSPKRSAAEVGVPHLKGSYIQTDAALNSGNSGGPLINHVGEVVGINTMVRSNTEAIGFAIPINQAKEIFPILKEGKKPTHAYFGLELTSLTPDNARINNDDPNSQRLPITYGALVMRVVPNAPSSTSLRKYDVIIEINGNPIKDVSDADYYLDKSKVGQPSTIRILRGENGIRQEITVTPQDYLQMMEERKMKKLMEFFKPAQ